MRSITGSNIASSNSQTTNSTVSSENALSISDALVTSYSPDRSWKFSVFSYLAPENIDLNSTLTYLSPQTREFEIEQPIDFITVVYQNGTVVWSWAVPGAIGLFNVTQDQRFTDFNQIPDSVMQIAGTYTIEVIPLVSTSNGTSLQQQLEVNVTIQSSGFFGTTITTTPVNLTTTVAPPPNVTTVTINSTIPTTSNQNPVLTTNLVYSYNEIPPFFSVGNFTLQLLNQSNNGTQYSFTFNVTTPDEDHDMIAFSWDPPCSLNLNSVCLSNNTWTLPNPENATVNYGAANLEISWYQNSTGLYATFQEWDQIQIVTTTTTSTNQPWITLDSSDGASACSSIQQNQSFSATWRSNVCTLTGSDMISNFALRPYTNLDILPGVTLVLNGGGFANYGTIINNGTIDIETSFVTYGVIVNGGLISTNSTVVSEIDDNFGVSGGTIQNYGNFSINGQIGYYPNNETYSNGTTYITAGDEYLTGGSFSNGGILNNYGIINSTGEIWNGESGLNYNSTINNYGIIRNLDQAVFNNNYTINNYETIDNSGTFVNNGTIINFCYSNFVELGGSFSGNGITGACGTTFSTLVTSTVDEENSSS